MRNVTIPPLLLAAALLTACVETAPSAHPDEGGDMVLVGTALGTSEDCSLTGDDAEGLMYLGRAKQGGSS